MAHIALQKGAVAIVDEDDLPRLSCFRWYFTSKGKKQRQYAIGRPDGRRTTKAVYMHRLIMGNPEGMHIDHINGDTLDNRKANLRICTPKQNSWNMGPRPGASRFRGVHWCSRTRRWHAVIVHNYKARYIRNSKSEEEAARAYDKVAKELFGEFARLNFPEEASSAASL